MINYHLKMKEMDRRTIREGSEERITFVFMLFALRNHGKTIETVGMEMKRILINRIMAKCFQTLLVPFSGIGDISWVCVHVLPSHILFQMNE